MLNIFLYLMGLLPLTHLIVTMKPTMTTNGTGEHNITMVNVSFLEVIKGTTGITRCCERMWDFLEMPVQYGYVFIHYWL